MGWTGGAPPQYPVSGVPEARSPPCLASPKIPSPFSASTSARTASISSAWTRAALIVLHQKLSRGQLEARLANMPPCLIGWKPVSVPIISAASCWPSATTRLIPAKYVKAFLKGHKNDFRDAEAIAEAVQRPTMRFVPTKTVEQLDLQALHRVRRAWSASGQR